jgi:hypothetical protein
MTERIERQSLLSREILKKKAIRVKYFHIIAPDEWIVMQSIAGNTQYCTHREVYAFKPDPRG